MMKYSFPDHEVRNKAFADALLDPDIPIPEGIGKTGNAAPMRFSVYRNNVVVSLMEALQAAYPSVYTIMGSENFSRVARIFVSSHPPTSPMMQEYGRDFPGFLANFKPLAKSPFLIDLALAEMHWLKSYHAVDAPCLLPQHIASLAPEAAMKMKLCRHPAACLLCSDYPVHDLFNARRFWPCPELDIATAQNILITRPALECLVTPIDAGQAKFFEAAFAGNCLGDAISAATQIDSDFDPADAIARGLTTGAFCKPETSDNQEET